MSGYNDKEVAHELNLSLDTVRTYWKRIRNKMGGQTRAQIIAALSREPVFKELEAVKIEAQLLKKEIEKRRKVERLLRESENKYRTLFENTLDAIFLGDDQGYYVDVNPAAAKLLGYRRDQIIGHHYSEFIRKEDLRSARDVGKALKKDGIWEGNFTMVRKDGTTVELHYRSMINVLPNQVFGVATPVDQSSKQKAQDREEEPA